MSTPTENIKVGMPDLGILVQSRAARPGFANVPHSHDQHSLLVVVAGQGHIEYGDQTSELNAHSVVMLKSRRPHRLIDRSGRQMTVISIYFDDSSGLDASITAQLLAANAPCVLPPYSAELVRRNLRQMLYEQAAKPPGYEVAVRETLNLILLTIYRAALDAAAKPPQAERCSSSERVCEFLDYAARNYFEQISLPDAARLAGLSQRRFSGLCRQLCGRNLVSFINQVRTDKARELLTTTDIPISAIAFKVGYEDLSTFYRAFKKYQKLSPSSCRRG